MGKQQKEVKTKSEMTASETRRLVERGRQIIRKVLEESTNSIRDRDLADRIIRIYENEFRLQMDVNDSLFEDVNTFLSEKKSVSEKNVFFTEVIKFLQKEGRIADVIAARYPEAYSVMDISFREAMHPLKVYLSKKTAKAGEHIKSGWGKAKDMCARACKGIKDATGNAKAKIKAFAESKEK